MFLIHLFEHQKQRVVCQTEMSDDAPSGNRTLDSGSVGASLYLL